MGHYSMPNLLLRCPKISGVTALVRMSAVFYLLLTYCSTTWLCATEVLTLWWATAMGLVLALIELPFAMAKAA